MITAEKIYEEIFRDASKREGKLFAVIAKRGFEKDLYTHDEVFEQYHRSNLEH